MKTRKKIRWNESTNGVAKKIFTKKILTGTLYLLASAANHDWYKNFFFGCMKWQPAVILEQNSETDSIKIFFPAKRTGVLTPLLTCFTFFSFSLLLEQIILGPTLFLLFAFSNKNFLSPIRFISSLWREVQFQFQKYVLRQFQFLSQPQNHFNFAKKF